MTIPVEVTIKIVVESEIDPREKDGYLPDDFKRLSYTPRVTEFMDHLNERVMEYLAETSGVEVTEFEILDEWVAE